jgi:hypothetical protein
MPEIPEANGEVQTIELVNEKTGEEESYVVHDVVEIEGETYYVLHDRVVEQLEEFEEEDDVDDDGGPQR